MSQYPVSYTHLDVYKRQVVPQPVIIGSYSYMGKNYPLNKTVDDMYLFFCKYLRRTDAE